MRPKQGSKFNERVKISEKKPQQPGIWDLFPGGCSELPVKKYTKVKRRSGNKRG
jgi:hypothetical protein